ncbi:Endonuclease 8-like 1 [Hypsibius exemplaris]|uniref:Endonuclease 8-like 1 n=1 Tax=Hypsibius exemplaris TaxID=2072580 RepID=A0A1W0WF53_HYPEX|nr:Endonuclease 8-like 1 [Hypsibius exemplaris]
MPELAEIHLASRLINRVAAGRFFKSPVIKSEVSTKMKDLEWNSEKFTVESTARGKELQMVLTDVSESKKSGPEDGGQKLTLTFGFGMTGMFSFDRFDQLPKHAHLQFITTETPANVLSFVDYRRFGKWDVRDYDFTRSPDPVKSPREFRHKVLTNLNKAIFNKAICEAILDQQYFNGIGNYLRAEILFRAKVPPFTQARTVLEGLPVDHEVDQANPDLLDLCSLVPAEVFGFTKPIQGYNPGSLAEVYAPFKSWLRCYGKANMKNLVDNQSRTIWFDGPAGPMVPKNKGSRHTSKRKSDEEVAGPKKRKLNASSAQDEASAGGSEIVTAPPKKRRNKKAAAVSETTIEAVVETAQAGKKIKRAPATAAASVAGVSHKSKKEKSAAVDEDGEPILRRSTRSTGKPTPRSTRSTGKPTPR